MSRSFTWGAAVLTVAMVLLPLRLRAQSSPAYVPCLGCAEHTEIENRWHRPFLIQLAGEGLLMANHFRLEGDARELGMCESDVLIRSSSSVAGCHPYSATRAWLIEAPVEIVLFTSPAWGLARRGHPRWAMALEAVPMAYHGFSSAATVSAMHQFQRELALFH